MASTDPSDRGLGTGFRFKEWLNGVMGYFSGGGGQRIVVPANGTKASIGGAPPAEALLARKRAQSRITGGMRSRKEEARQKNCIYENEIEPVIRDKLKTMFHPENYARMKLSPSSWTNTMRRIVDDISILYEKPAQRYLVTEDDDTLVSGADAEAGITETTGVETTANGTTEQVPAGKTAKKAPSKDGKQKDKKPDEEEEEEETDEEKDTEATDEEPPEDESEEDTDEEEPAEETDDEGNDKKDPTQKKAPGAGPETKTNGAGEDVENPNTGVPKIDALVDVLDAEVGQKQDAFEALMKLVDLDTLLDSVEKKTRFHEAVWVRPYVTYDDVIEEKLKGEDGNETGESKLGGDPSTGKLTYIVYTPANADVVENPMNPSEALAFYYWGQELTEKGEMDTFIHFFTKTLYIKFDKDWAMVLEEENPLGRLPVTVFRKELPSDESYFCKGVGRDLMEATVEFNVMRTIQNVRYRDSGFKQLALVNVDDEKVMADQILGGPTPIYIPDGGSATVLDMTPALQQMTEAIKERALELAATYGITAAAYKADGAPQSGFAKKLDRDQVLKENRRIRKFFAVGEKDLYNLTALTLNHQPIDGIGTLNPDAEYAVDFGEPSFEENPTEQNPMDAQAMKLNKTNIVEILRRDNPDLTDAQLVRMAYRNQRINEAFTTPQAMKLIDVLSGGSQAEMSFERMGGGGGPPGGKPPFGGKPKFGGGGKPPFGGDEGGDE